MACRYNYLPDLAFLLKRLKISHFVSTVRSCKRLQLFKRDTTCLFILTALPGAVNIIKVSFPVGLSGKNL
jgi:hypothetical protein